jgi:hypothetical protein
MGKMKPLSAAELERLAAETLPPSGARFALVPRQSFQLARIRNSLREEMESETRGPETPQERVAGAGPVADLVEAARRAMAFIAERKFATAEAHLRSGLEAWDRAGPEETR